jgi:large subunit ribosomal protein L17
MRHRRKGRSFSRTAEHRKAMMRNLATSLFLHGRLETTTEKAKELKRYAEPLITKAKRGDLHARRQVARKIQDDAALAKLFSEIGPRFAERPGGYTRVRLLGHRAGDAAEMALIELVD